MKVLLNHNQTKALQEFLEGPTLVREMVSMDGPSFERARRVKIEKVGGLKDMLTIEITEPEEERELAPLVIPRKSLEIVTEALHREANYQLTRRSGLGSDGRAFVDEIYQVLSNLAESIEEIRAEDPS